MLALQCCGLMMIAVDKEPLKRNDSNSPECPGKRTYLHKTIKSDYNMGSKEK